MTRLELIKKTSEETGKPIKIIVQEMMKEERYDRKSTSKK